jgi:hypothetical protein
MSATAYLIAGTAGVVILVGTIWRLVNVSGLSRAEVG